MSVSRTLVAVGAASLAFGCVVSNDVGGGSGGAAGVSTGVSTGGALGVPGAGGALPGAGGTVGGVGTGGTLGAVGAGGTVGGFGTGGTLGGVGTGGTVGGVGTGGTLGGVGTGGTLGGVGTGGAVGVGGGFSSGGSGAGGSGAGGSGAASSGGAGSGGSQGGDGGACENSQADDKFSFFVTSWFGIKELAQSNDGFGGDLRYPKGTGTGLEGADNICQALADTAGCGNRTWKAWLSSSQEDAKDRVGTGPWYNYDGELVADDVNGLLNPSGNCDGQYDGRLPGAVCGTVDEQGTRHDGKGDTNGDGTDKDDDHDTMTATLADGTYAGFSCSDWTSVTDTFEGGGGGFPGGGGGGIQMGHSWPAGSGKQWTEAHAGHSCAAGVNFVQDGPGDSATVGGGGGYGGFYCFAIN